jgi:hypothetical protein
MSSTISKYAKAITGIDYKKTMVLNKEYPPSLTNNCCEQSVRSRPQQAISVFPGYLIDSICQAVSRK